MLGLFFSKDDRTKYTKKLLEEKGIQTLFYDQWDKEKNVDFVVFPMSGIDKKNCIDVEKTSISVKTLLKEFHKKITVFSTNTCDLLKNYHVINIMAQENYVKRNSELTAEGVLYLILDHKKKALDQYTYDVVGYGHCGKEIVELLTRLRLRVRIISHSLANGMCEINHHHVPIIDLNDYAYILPSDIIINTAPKEVVTYEMNELWADKPMIIDISTRHVGVSEKIVKEDLQVIKAGTLPSIVAMETAAQILYELIIKEMKV